MFWSKGVGGGFRVGGRIGGGRGSAGGGCGALVLVVLGCLWLAKCHGKGDGGSSTQASGSGYSVDVLTDELRDVEDQAERLRASLHSQSPGRRQSVEQRIRDLDADAAALRRMIAEKK